MIRHLSPVLFVALGFAVSSLHADEKEIPADVQIEVLLSEGDKVVERSVIHTDLRGNSSNALEGTTIIRPPEGGRWIVEIAGSIGDEAESRNERELYVTVSDAQELRERMREGNKSITPVTIFNSTRVWHGPGTYRVGEFGRLTLSFKVADTPAVKAKSGEPTTPPATEKK